MKKFHLLITAALLTTLSASVMAANDNPYSGRTFGGALINNSDWSGMSTSEIPYGMHTFQIGGTTYTPVITDHDYGFMAAAYGNGTLIGIREASFMGVLTGVFNYDLSVDDPTKRKVTLIDGQELSYAALSSVMTYSPIDNVYYSVNYNSDLTGLTWNRYNRKTQRFETIALWPNRFQPLALAVGNDNTIYCIAKDGYLYTLNSETGAASMVGELGVTPALNSQSACYDGKTNTLLWAAMADVNGFYSVDVETGAATLISEFGKQEQFAAIFPMEYTAQPEAPANPAELKIVYDADGSLAGKITFTAPSTLQNGNALTGNVTVLTYVDGVKKDSRSVAAGSNVEVPVELSNDNHYVAVYAKSKGKYSAPVSFNTYSGYDTPLAPTDAIFTCNEGNASLSWTAPTAGINNGYINPNALTYNIIRMPEGVSVANGLTATEFSETLPDEMRRYYYKVTACNGSSDKESEPAISNNAVWGSAYPVPFSSTFDTQEIADTYTVANKNEDDKTWRYDSYNHNMGIDTYQVANSNDWLISPAISMEKGMLYEMSAFVHTYGRNYPENFRLLVGTNPADVNSFNLYYS